MRNRLKWSSVALFVAALGIQLLPSPIERERQLAQTAPFRAAMDPEVGAIIQRACKDCHSNETTWPWYSQVAPVSWMMAWDVKKGREKLNFSDWVSRERSANEVEEICDAATNGSMPLPRYRLVHREATLSKHDVEVICDWADTAMAQARRVADERVPAAEAADRLRGALNEKQRTGGY